MYRLESAKFKSLAERLVALMSLNSQQIRCAVLGTFERTFTALGSTSSSTTSGTTVNERSLTQLIYALVAMQPNVKDTAVVGAWLHCLQAGFLVISAQYSTEAGSVTLLKFLNVVVQLWKQEKVDATVVIASRDVLLNVLPNVEVFF